MTGPSCSRLSCRQATGFVSVPTAPSCASSDNATVKNWEPPLRRLPLRGLTMQTRHRVPSVFNISMVDVLCCALGCVILLWLLNLRDAKETAATVGATTDLLDKSKHEGDELRARLRDTDERLKSLQADRDKLAQRADATLQDLTAARARLAELDKESASMKVQANTAAERLAQLTREQRDLTKERADALTRVRSLETQVLDKEKLASKSRQQMLDLAEQLQAAE